MACGTFVSTENQTMSFAQVRGANANMKEEQSIGSAAGYQAALANQGKDAAIISSMYGTQSNIEKTMAKVNTQGGVENAVATDVAESSIKALQQKAGVSSELTEMGKQAGMKESDAKKLGEAMGNAAVQAMQGKVGSVASGIAGGAAAMQSAKTFEEVTQNKAAGVLGSNNQMTSAGYRAMAINPGESASSMMSKSAWANDKNEVGAMMSQLEAKTPGFTDTFRGKDGNYLTGQALLNRMAENKALSFKAVNAMVGSNGATFDGAVGDGVVTGHMNDGLSQSTDTSTNNKFGHHNNYSPLGDLLQDPDLYKVGKTLIEGAGWLGVADVLSGGKVRQGLGKIGQKGRDIKDRFTGRTSGKGDNGKTRSFNPNNPLDVDEYLENNRGAKSRVDYERSGRDPSGPSNPHKKESTASTPNTTNAENTAFAIDSSSNKFSNSSIMPNDNAHVKGKIGSPLGIIASTVGGFILQICRLEERS